MCLCCARISKLTHTNTERHVSIYKNRLWFDSRIRRSQCNCIEKMACIRLAVSEFCERTHTLTPLYLCGGGYWSAYIALRFGLHSWLHKQVKVLFTCVHIKSSAKPQFYFHIYIGLDIEMIYHCWVVERKIHAQKQRKKWMKERTKERETRGTHETWGENQYLGK